MRDVAAKADVALGTLYRYFPSKDHLLIAALAEQVSTLHRRLNQKPARGGTPTDRVVDVLHRASRALEREPKLTAAVVARLSSPDPEVAEDKQAVFDILGAVIADAVDGDALPEREGVVRVLSQRGRAALECGGGA